MPTYDYECEACSHRWEEYASIKAPPTKVCPEYHAESAKRLISAGGGILFKGSGFYITDYRSESYKKGAEADKSASASSGSKDGGSSGSTGASGGTGSTASKPEAKPASGASPG